MPSRARESSNPPSNRITETTSRTTPVLERKSTIPAIVHNQPEEKERSASRGRFDQPSFISSRSAGKSYSIVETKKDAIMQYRENLMMEALN